MAGGGGAKGREFNKKVIKEKLFTHRVEGGGGEEGVSFSHLGTRHRRSRPPAEPALIDRDGSRCIDLEAGGGGSGG